jgi:hypothetical protein
VADVVSSIRSSGWVKQIIEGVKYQVYQLDIRNPKPETRADTRYLKPSYAVD